MQILTDGKCYEIFNGDKKSNIVSAPPGLVGTASALRDAVCNGFPSFYWFPSVVNFPGIDGILVNGKNIYALQATIADTHRMPDAELKKAWEAIGAASAQLYNWHFVMVTDKQGLAEKYVKTDLVITLILANVFSRSKYNDNDTTTVLAFTTCSQ